jgi:hypothetical protein
MDTRPLRMPQRVLTPEQAAKFAALRLEIETELAARSASRGGADERTRTCTFRLGRLRSARESSRVRRPGQFGR